jgi:hypothetical protein
MIYRQRCGKEYWQPKYYYEFFNIEYTPRLCLVHTTPFKLEIVL